MRRAVLCLCLSAFLSGAGGTDPRLSAFDDWMTAILAKWQIPGAALAVSHDGRLVLDRVYGAGESGARFPIRGLSKAIAAAAVLRLAENGRLSLDDRAESGATFAS